MAAFAVAMLGTMASCTKRSIDGTLLECQAASTDPTGAMEGPLLIAGHVRDVSGAAVVGARVTLGGDAQGFRVSDFGGGYRFRVQPGSYTVTAAGDCSFSPAMATLQATSGDMVQDFAVAGGDCATVTVSSLEPSGSVLTIRRGGRTLGTTVANVTQATDHAAGVARLRDIASENDTPTCAMTIAASPATERRARIMLRGLQGGPGTEIIALTTAIAIGDLVVRFESALDVNEPAEVVDLFMAAARAFSPEQVSELRLQ